MSILFVFVVFSLLLLNRDFRCGLCLPLWVLGVFKENPVEIDTFMSAIGNACALMIVGILIALHFLILELVL